MAGLSDVMNVAASGMRAAKAQLNVAAQNLANSDTPGYQARRVDLVSLSPQAGGGVAVGGVNTYTTPADPLTSNVDPAAEAVSTISARVLYTANAKVLRTADQMMGTLLDVVDETHRRR